MKVNDLPEFSELIEGDRAVIVRADGTVGLVDKSLLGSSGGGGEEPPDEEPPVVAIPAYTASQSSVYAGLTGTYANLTDTDGTTGAATNQAQEYIRASWETPQTITAVSVGGGNLPGWGAVAPYLNNAKLQYTTDGMTWTDILTISGVADSGLDQFKKFILSTPIQAKGMQLQMNGYLATTYLKFEQ